MKLKLKLPLAFAIANGLLFLAGLFGIWQLSASITTFEVEVLRSVSAHKKAAEVNNAFAIAIQEWKNVLLRGKDSGEQTKYWAAYQKEVAESQKLLQELGTLIGNGPSLSTVQKLTGALSSAANGYAKAYEAFKTADADYAAGDKAAKGVDREAVAALKDLRQQLSEQELQATEAAIAGAASARRTALLLMCVITGLGVASGIWLSRKIVAPLEQAVHVANAVAQGDLSQPIEVTSRDEVGQLLEALQSMQHKLSILVANVRQGSESVSMASAEIAQGNNDLSARTEQQAAAVEQTNASMRELGGTVTQNADAARQANQLAGTASTVAVQGGAVVGRVVETMRDINTSSQRIADIISVIDGIAFQTNILALNAAVEAARAGEQGRGFAVVASEVRALAGRSAEAAKEIKTLITDSVEKVAHGTSLVDQAGATMTEVVSSIRRVTDIMGEISAASNEQSSGVNQISEAIGSMDQATQQNAALVEEMAAAASSLKQQSQELVQVVAAFKIRNDTHATLTQKTEQHRHHHTPTAATRSVAAAKRSASPPAHIAPAAVAGARPVATVAGGKSTAKAAAAEDDWETF